MNQAFVYTQEDGKKLFIGLFDLENIEENVRQTLLDRSMARSGYQCFFIFNNETFKLNV